MKSVFACLIAGLLLAGCEPTTGQEAAVPAEGATANQPVPETGGSSSVQIHTGGAGGIAPVTGTENLGGGGGGVNQAAKNSARNAADRAGGSSLDQLGSESTE